MILSHFVSDSLLLCLRPYNERFGIVKKRKKKAAQCPNIANSINLKKQAMFAIFRLVTGTNTLGLKAQFDRRGSTAGSACYLGPTRVHGIGKAMRVLAV